MSLETNRPAVLEVSDLGKRYGARDAVRSVSFRVDRNEIVGLLGPNGAGKTTTISMLLGVLTPDSGRICIDGIDLATDREAALARTNFAAIYAPLPGNLTVRQNLRYMGMLYDVKHLDERIEQLIGEFDLQAFRDTRCGLLSSGEQTRVSLAKAMLNQPSLLLLDEPTASLDPATARDLRRKIVELGHRGDGAILWTSHNMAEVTEVCDRVLFMSQGRLLLQGNPRELPAEHGVATLDDLFVKLAQERLPEVDA